MCINTQSFWMLHEMHFKDVPCQSWSLQCCSMHPCRRHVARHFGQIKCLFSTWNAVQFALQIYVNNYRLKTSQCNRQVENHFESSLHNIFAYSNVVRVCVSVRKFVVSLSNEMQFASICECSKCVFFSLPFEIRMYWEQFNPIGLLVPNNIFDGISYLRHFW